MTGQVLAAVTRQAGWFAAHMKRLAALPSHGNRQLHADQLFLGLLLAFYDPLTRSLRSLEDKGDFGGRLEIGRLARSTTSDALAVTDPACLAPLLADLRRRIPNLGVVDADLAGISRRIIAADGTYLTTLADVAWALHHTKSNGRRQGQVRVNVQLDTAAWTPQVVTVSGDDGQSEPAAFAGDLLSDALYVCDRNFVNFSFIDALLERGNDFVLRGKRDAPAAQVLAELPISAQDAEAGVVSDQIVRLTGRHAPRRRLRRVTLCVAGRDGEPQTLRLLSSLVDPAIGAKTIGAIYRQRWQIELFFKWLKTWARLDRLLSTSRHGMTFQLYVAVIGVLLMHAQTGRRVSQYTLIALSRLASGEFTLQRTMEVIAFREREAALNRARQARRRAQKKLA